MGVLAVFSSKSGQTFASSTLATASILATITSAVVVLPLRTPGKRSSVDFVSLHTSLALATPAAFRKSRTKTTVAKFLANWLRTIFALVMIVTNTISGVGR